MHAWTDTASKVRSRTTQRLSDHAGTPWIIRLCTHLRSPVQPECMPSFKHMGGGAYCLLRCYKIHGHFSKTHCFTQTVKLVFSSVIKKKQKTKTKQQYYIIHFPLQKQSNVIHCLLPARHFTVFYINTYEDHKQSTAHQWCMQRIMQVSKRSNTFNGLALRNHHMKTFYLIGWICWFTTENLQNWWHSHQPRLYIVPNAHQQMLTWLCKMAQVLYLLNIITMCLKALLYSLTEQFP